MLVESTFHATVFVYLTVSVAKKAFLIWACSSQKWLQKSTRVHHHWNSCLLL